MSKKLEKIRTNWEVFRKDNMNLWRRATINSIGTAIYIAIVAILMTNAEHLFGAATGVLGGVAILLLFTLSALIVGTLILGKPLMMYLDGNKKESVKLLLLTVLILAIITIVFLGVLVFIKP